MSRLDGTLFDRFGGALPNQGGYRHRGLVSQGLFGTGGLRRFRQPPDFPHRHRFFLRNRRDLRVSPRPATEQAGKPPASGPDRGRRKPCRGQEVPPPQVRDDQEGSDQQRRQQHDGTGAAEVGNQQAGADLGAEESTHLERDAARVVRQSGGDAGDQGQPRHSRRAHHPGAHRLPGEAVPPPEQAHDRQHVGGVADGAEGAPGKPGADSASPVEALHRLPGRGRGVEFRMGRQADQKEDAEGRQQDTADMGSPFSRDKAIRGCCHSALLRR